MDLHSVDPAGQAELADALLQVQRAAYAVEAALVGDERIPPLHEHLDDLRSAPLTWLAAFDGAALLGAVAWTEDLARVEIDRLLVSPDVHRRGVGSALVRAVIHRAVDRQITVSTGQKNTPARRLYERLNFTWADDVEVVPGLWISRYVHGL